MFTVSICIPRYVVFLVGPMFFSGASGTPSSVKLTTSSACLVCTVPLLALRKNSHPGNVCNTIYLLHIPGSTSVSLLGH